MGAARQIYAAAGWWNEHWGRIKTLATWVAVAGAIVLVVGGFLVHRFGLEGGIAIAVGGVFLFVAFAAFVVERVARRRVKPLIATEPIRPRIVRAIRAELVDNLQAATRYVDALKRLPETTALTYEAGFRFKTKTWSDASAELAADADLFSFLVAAYTEVDRANREIGWRETQAKGLFGVNRDVDDLPAVQQALRSAVSAIDAYSAGEPLPPPQTGGPAIAVYVPERPCERYHDAAGGDCIWCHLAVEAVSDQVLRKCHARLIHVERAEDQQWVRDSRFAAPIRLKWAFAGRDHPEVEYRDIRPGEPALLDVVFTLERAPGRAFIETLDAQPIGLPRELGPGMYQVTVRILADDRDPVDHTVMLGVSEQWQSVSMGAHIGPPVGSKQ